MIAPYLIAALIGASCMAPVVSWALTGWRNEARDHLAARRALDSADRIITNLQASLTALQQSRESNGRFKGRDNG